MKHVLASLLLLGALMASTVGTAFAVGGPNEAGNSGKFWPQSNPCQSQNNHPNCPGIH